MGELVKDEKEAIEVINSYPSYIFKPLREALDMAVDALEYRIAKKPDYTGDYCDENGIDFYDCWLCPKCGKEYEIEFDDYKYCPECGQKIEHEEWAKKLWS